MGKVANQVAIKTLFHKLANEGRAITRIRQAYRISGKNICAYRAEMLIRLKELNLFFNDKYYVKRN